MEKLCKCTNCKEVYKDPFKNESLMVKSRLIPKRVLALDNDFGCPKCLSWDYLEDLTTLLELSYRNIKEAFERIKIDYPGAIFLRAGSWSGTQRQSINSNKYYYFLL